MQERGRGAIVNIGSTVIVRGSPRAPIYAAGKYGLIGITKSYAKALAPEVRVNTFAPGFMDTPAVMNRPDMKSGRLEQLQRDTPMGRIPPPEDVAGAALFLATDDASPHHRQLHDLRRRLLDAGRVGRLHPGHQRGDRGVQRRRHADVGAGAHDAAVEGVDLGRPVRERVLEHARLVVVVLAGGAVDHGLGIGVEHDAERVRDAPPLGDEAAGHRAQVGPVAQLAVREARQRGERVRRRVEQQLRPLGAASVVERDGAGRARERVDLLAARRLRLERARSRSSRARPCG